MATGLNIITEPKSRQSKAEWEAQVRGSYWLPTQQRWIDSNRRLKILVKCRRFGGSWAEAYRVMECAAREDNPYDAWIGSRDMLAARLFTNDVKKWARTFTHVAKDLNETFIDLKKDMGAFQLTVGDHTITSLSSSPDTFAGKQGRFTLDEGALHRDGRQLYAIVQPAIMRGGSISYISTQRGRKTWFNQLVEEIEQKGNPKKFDFFKITIVEAVREGLWIKIRDALPEEDERKDWTEDEFLQSLYDECAGDEAWKQEYMCEPADDAESLLTWEEITNVTINDVEKAILNALPPDAPRYVGMDVARKKHLSVIWQWVDVNGILLPERIEVMEKQKFSVQEEKLYQMIDPPNVKGVRIDATGLGMQLAERAEDRHPQKVQGKMLSAPEKLRLAVQLHRRTQDRSLRFPSDNKTQYDLYSVKKEVTANQNILLKSEAGETDGHADRFWAAALGVDAADNTGDPGFFSRIKALMRGGSAREDDNSRRSARQSRSCE